MYALGFSGEQKASLSSKAESIRRSAVELVRFHETSPDLASLAGVEVSALEARFLLGHPMFRMNPSSLSGRSITPDFETLSRLEGVVSIAEARIESCLGAMEARESSSPVEKLSGIIGLATGALSLVKSIV